ncbi:LPXTG cell wall anchor domain-containing protein [Streptomyces roseirectus]|uniref:LPXTG cell wall anchor domain-containing protein n=1 Tax=Streptomyces roseirectus TaxID=2768066 RepID=A0A7H0IF08_9ACTN|nr:LAETG motif-containing sortase-dependent surface protein [Streptomyces roseirectus]QNP71374.1 LPXTG cell wall anchor domain-containing protein [Streptomyces roseirectus]
MSIARNATARRLLGTGVASLALAAASVAAASGAWASGGGHGWQGGGQYRPGSGAGEKTEADRCQFSLDGTSFFDSVRVDDQNLKPSADGKVHVTVLGAGGTCTVSLASYLAHGATFETSGEQVFVDFDTVTVKRGQKDTLDIAVPDAGCFAQVDLYRGSVRFDGKKDAQDGFEHGELPKGPDRPVIKDKLIAAWNGGTKDCTVTEQPPTSPPASPPATPPAEQPPASTPPSPDEEPPVSSSPSPSPSVSESAPESTPPGEGGSSESPTPTPSASASTPAAAPTPNGGGGGLAETGAGNNTGALIGGAAALLAGGAAIVVATRRRRGTQG